MEKYFFVIWLSFAPIFVCAQFNLTRDEYDKLRDAELKNNTLKMRVEALEDDSASRSRENASLKKANSALERERSEYKLKSENTKKQLAMCSSQLSDCRKDSANMRKELNSVNFTNLKQCNKRADSLLNEINLKNEKISNLEESVRQKNNELNRLTATENLFNTHFGGKTVDELVNVSKDELVFYREWLKQMEKPIPQALTDILCCYEAKEQLEKKYDKTRLTPLQQNLPVNSDIGKNLKRSIDNYANINGEANALWKRIEKECNEREQTDAFNLLKYHRVICIETQEFFNKYPKLSSEYPYVFEQLQKMLRYIWDNPNNFKGLKNPFE